MVPQQFDFEDTWETLVRVVTKEGPGAAVKHIANESDWQRRNAWFRFCYQGLVFRAWDGKNLAAMIVVASAAIDNALAGAEKFPDEVVWWIDQANVHCYNASANLADCWGDGLRRDKQHFEAGLKFAERAIAFREQLNKPAGPRAMATWAAGKHLLSLQRFAEAKETFLQSFVYEAQLAETGGTPATLSVEAHFGFLLCVGYLALCDMASGDREKAEVFQEILTLIEAKGAGSEEAKEDAAVYCSQLQETKKALKV